MGCDAGTEDGGGRGAGGAREATEGAAEGRTDRLLILILLRREC